MTNDTHACTECEQLFTDITSELENLQDRNDLLIQRINEAEEDITRLKRVIERITEVSYDL